MFNDNMLFDAQAALGFVTSQTTHIESAVNETVYPDVQYSQLTPVDTSAHPFTQTVTFYSSDKVGKANWINGNGDDIPLANSELTQHKSSVYTAGIGYGFGWEEVGIAMKLGHNLQGDDAAAARRAYEEMVDMVALRGDARKGFSGLIDYPGITAGAVPTGNWAAATDEDLILADVNAVLLGIPTDTLFTSVADTLLMSPGRMNLLATRRLGDTTMTVLDFLRKNNTYTAMTGQALTIRGVRGLETAGAGVTQRMVAYRRSPDVLKLHIPMPHRFLPVFQNGPLSWVVPGVFRLGGLDIRRPKEVRYGDGI
ncbi:major capsid protein [Aminobacter phage Erebus]|nr:major capsid protein [Aminobacter phage Erebus]